MSDKYFVIVSGLRGPEPQIWHSSQVNGEGKEKPHLWKIKLEANQHHMKISELQELFKDEISRLSDNSEQNNKERSKEASSSS